MRTASPYPSRSATIVRFLTVTAAAGLVGAVLATVLGIAFGTAGTLAGWAIALIIGGAVSGWALPEWGDDA